METCLWNRLKNLGLAIAMASVFSGSIGCKDANQRPEGIATPHKHEHVAPHGGTPVVLGVEEAHLEFVLDAAAGKLQAYVMDGHLENFVRITAESFTVTVRRGSAAEALTFKAVASGATGERVGDSSLFETRAEWLKSTSSFDATIDSLTVRGKTYENVKFNFPKGNEEP